MTIKKLKQWVKEVERLAGENSQYSKELKSCLRRKETIRKRKKGEGK